MAQDLKDIVISIIIPMYNSARTVIETLDSVRKQSFDLWEVICIDDGSTDESFLLVEEYAKKYSRFSVYKRDSLLKGGSVCRNEGAHIAKGNYLIFLDADDLLSPSCLKDRLKTIENTGYDFVVYPMASFIDNINDAKMYSRLKAKNELYCFASGAPTWQVTSPIIRKSFFDSIGGFDEQFQRYQDVEFHLRAIINSNFNYRIMRNNAPDCFYRNSISFKSSSVKLENSLVACLQILKLFRSFKSKIGKERAYPMAIASIYMNYMLFYYGLKQINNKASFSIDNDYLNEVKREVGDKWGKLLSYIVSLPYNRINLFKVKVMRKLVYFIISRNLL